jgi:signal transduction histidine kinase
MTDSILMDPTYIRGGSSPRRPAKKIVEKLRQLPSSSFLLNSIVFHDEDNDSSSFTFNYFGNACHYDAKKDTLIFFEGDQNFQNVLKLDGRVFFVRENPELWEFDNHSKQLFPVKVENMPAWNEKDALKPLFIWKPMMEAPLLVYNQRVWKLQRSNDNTLRLVPVCIDCYPPNADIRSVQIWKEQGLILLGSEANGLFVVKVPFLRTIREDTTTVAGKPEYAQVEIEPGIINTASGLSYTTEGKLLQGERKIWFPQSNIYQNKQGDCWYTSVDVDTIIHYHRQTHRYTKVLFPGAHRIVVAETNNRLFAIADIGIAEITGDQFRILYKLPARSDALMNSLNPTAAIEWKPGLLALAGEKLLFYDTEKGSAPDTVVIPGLSSQVRALEKYGDYLLIGTYGEGFYIYKNGVVKKMPLDKSKYLSYTHCFMPDDKGFCWISTNHGLFKVSMQSLIAAYENNLSGIYYHYLGKDDGIYNTEFNGGCQPCALRLSNGMFSFPSMNGAVIMDPDKQHSPPPSGKLFIEEILSDTIAHRPGDDALQHLPSNLRNLSFQIALPQFGNTENIYFSYKLEPYHETWQTQELSKNNTLQFGKLPPGDYTLYLRVRNGFETDAFGITSIEFRILYPWYREWWFYLLCLAGLVVIIWALVRWRTARINRRKKELQQLVSRQTKDLEQQSRKLTLQLSQLQNQQWQLEEDNKIKARLIGIISHDMISPLKFMAFLSTELGGSFSADDPRYRKINLIGSVAKDLESLSVNVLNWIRFHHESLKIEPEQFHLHTAIEEAVVIPSALATEKGVSFHNDVPGNLVIYHYRQIVGVVIYNLAMNAMKYTSRGAIRITSKHTDSSLLLTISDTGAGMPADLVERLNESETYVTGYSAGDNKKYQFGFVIIKDLLRMVKGSMQVESRLDQGTKITVYFPQPENAQDSKQ